MMTIDGAFRDSVRIDPHAVALKYYHETRWEQITYEALQSAVTEVAYGLVDLGTARDSKVAVMSENRPEWIVTFLATLTAGAVSTPIDAVLGETEILHIINHSEAETIVCSMQCYDKLSRILSEIPHLRNIVIFDRNITISRNQSGDGKGRGVVEKGNSANAQKTFLSYDDLRLRGRSLMTSGSPRFPEKTVEDLATIVYTSGTTGTPKGVMLSHRNIMTNVDSDTRFMHFNNHDNFVLLLPLHHTFSFSVCMVLPLATGGAVSFVDIMSRERTRLIGECKPTILLGVPLLFSKMHRGITRQIEESRFKSFLYKFGGKKIIGSGLRRAFGGKLRIMVSGAAPMEPSVVEWFTDLGIEFLEGYGLTETSPIVSCNPIGGQKIGTVGVAMPGVDIRIDNPDHDWNGELCVRGGNVMMGYYKDSESTNHVLKDDWLSTGDIGKIDTDGYLTITGRSKNVIVTRGGKNVYPEGIEAELEKNPFISESVVIGYRTKGMTGEDVGVLIYPCYESLIEYAKKNGIALKIPKDIANLTEEDKDELIETFRNLIEKEVRSYMEKLASYQRITRIGIERDEFIKTSTRKIKRFLYKGRLDIVDIG